MTEQTVSTRLQLDASDFRKEAVESGKVFDQLAGNVKGAGDDIDRVFSGMVDSADKVGEGIRSLDSRLGALTGADRDLVIRSNVEQAERGIREIDAMLSDPRLTETELRILLDRRNEASRAIEDLKEQLGELGDEALEAGQDIERGLNMGALAGAAGSAGLANTIDGAVRSTGLLRAQMGLTADEVREFDVISKEVYRNNFGESMGHAAQVTGMVHQSLGLVGDDLSTATQLIFSVSDAFEHVGADTQILTDDLRVMRASWPGLDETRSLDLIAHSFQSGTGNAGDLLDTVQEYSPVFADMGFSADDMFTILDEGMRNGARNTDFLADAFKELGIRIQTEGDTGQQAIAKLFPPEQAQRLIDDFSRGGDAAREAFQVIAGALVDVRDPQEQYNLSVELFGTKAEDLSTSLIPTLQGSLQGLASVTDDAAGAAEATGAQYDGFRNTLDGLVRTLETSVVGQLGDVGVGVADVGANVGIAALGLRGIKDVIPGLSTGASGLAGTLGKLALQAGAVAVAGIAVERTLNAWSNMMSDAKEHGEEMARAFLGSFDATAAGLHEVHDRIIGINAEIEARRNAADEAWNPATIERHHKMADALEVERDKLLVTEAAAAELQAELGITADEAWRLANNAEAMGAATDQSTGGIDAAAAAAHQASMDTQAYADSIRAVVDAHSAALDPLFAAQDAMLGIGDAQREAEDANLAVLEAQDELNKAVKEYGDDSPEATRAARDLADAQRRADQASRNAARAAHDLDGALLELKASVEEGSVKFDHAVGTLDRWVREGKITEQQAKLMKDELFFAAVAAGELDTHSIEVPLTLEAQQFWQEMARARGALTELLVEQQLANPYAQTAGVQVRAHTGGFISGRGEDPIYRASGGPSGTDTVPAWLTEGEYVIRAPAVRALGVDTLHRLNQADTFTGAAMAPRPAAIDYDRLGAAIGRHARSISVSVPESIAGRMDERRLARELADLEWANA